jgi:hypothetical protein
MVSEIAHVWRWSRAPSGSENALYSIALTVPGRPIADLPASCRSGRPPILPAAPGPQLGLTFVEPNLISKAARQSACEA